jgi:hypothetical protein
MRLINAFIKVLSSLPDQTMKWFTQHQNKSRSFVEEYSWAWFAALVCFLCLTLYCYQIDFDVLYALKYNSSMAEDVSWWEAATSAAVIQFLLLVCGGSFLKNLIYGNFIKSMTFPKHKMLPSIQFNGSHLLQLALFGLLYAAGFYWTLSLSYKTDALALADAQETISQIDYNKKEEATLLKENYQQETANYRQDAQQQIDLVNAQYEGRLKALEEKYAAIFAQYEARHRAGQITGTYLKKRTSTYQKIKERNLSPLLEEQGVKVEAIRQALNTKLNVASSLYEEAKNNLENRTSNDRKKLNEQIYETGIATQGRNITFNCLNQLLWAGLLLFSFSAKKATPKPRPDNSPKKPRSHTTTNEQAHPHTDATPEDQRSQNSLHDTTRAASWQVYRRPKIGERPLEVHRNGWDVQIRPRSVWVWYNEDWRSKATVSSWIRKYEKEGNGTYETCKIYRQIVQTLEAVEEDIDTQRMPQAG